MDNNQNNYNNPYGEPGANYSQPTEAPTNNYYQPTETPNNNYYQPINSAPQGGRIPVAVKVLSIVALATGIFGLIFCWYPYGIFMIFSIAALVTRSIATSKAMGMYCGKFASMAKAGMITGIIGLVFNIVSLIIWAIISAINGFGDFYY